MRKHLYNYLRRCTIQTQQTERVSSTASPMEDFPYCRWSSFHRMAFMGAAIWVMAGLTNAQSTDSCSVSLAFLGSGFSSIPFDASSLRCSAVWNDYNFILRYAQNSTTIWSFLLSTPSTNSWVGMGFSKDGFMVGSSAIVGWIDQSGSATIKQYYLGGQSSAQVIADQGALNIVNNYKSLLVQGSTIYLAFQLQFSAPLTSAHILYAIGPQNILPSNNILSQHKDKVSTTFDFSTGTSSTSSSTDTLKRNHGILNLLGWGVLLPIGTIIARYFKQWGTTWFYMHIGFQFSGYILGAVGVALGVSLYDKLNVDVNKHRALGILIVSLGGLQVLALFLRPQKESKTRKYWNWYHHWVGRFLLVIAAVNIFYGIHLGNAGTTWNVSYGITVGFFLVTAVALELFVLIQRFRQPAESPSFPVYDDHI